MSDTATEPSDAPAKVYICPACGKRYDEPTTCSDSHPPTECVEYDRATVEAADGGDAAAIESVAQTEAEAVGGGAGAGHVDSEASPAVVPGTSAVVETPAATTEDVPGPTEVVSAPVAPAPAAPDVPAPAADVVPAPAADAGASSSIGDILGKAAAAVEDAAAAIRAAITAASGN